jgi:hypothetical protein
MKKRAAIVESNSIISWSLTWSDIEKFDTIEKENDNQSKEFKRDSLFIDRVKYRSSVDAFRQILGNSYLNDSLFACKNSFERLLWLLSNPLESKNRARKIGLMLALHQQQFGNPSFNNDSIDELLNDPSRFIDGSLIASNKTNGNFYILPEVSINADFGLTKVAVKISDLTVKSSIILNNKKGTFDKNIWENFWQLFNLIQESSEIVN